MNTLIDDSLFSISRTLCGTITKEIIDTFEIVIKSKLLCWRKLRLSTIMVKIYSIEDRVLNQIMK